LLSTDGKKLNTETVEDLRVREAREDLEDFLALLVLLVLQELKY